ncbi:hypothetical protein [Mycolicibacterium smegmatis]|uniref:hypothetical protein n=1 Tax=Mycolicibacterium smegmatis TaxID=1772 RepID=UPI001EFB7469|nr:hypothetical protein [Mycolicibacterium smegmatis]ULN72304.1 hypothetical protein KZ782_10615 [Mycolicibacterium smegmatis]
MPDEPYPTKVVDDKEYWVVECLVPKESDPERGAYIFFAKPLQGITGIAGLIKGDPGKHTIIDTTIDNVPLDYDDPTPDFMEFVEIQPGSDTQSQIVQLRASQRAGAPGQDGDTVLDPSDFDGGSAGDVIALNDEEDGFELVPQRVGGMHWAASLSNATAGTTATAQIGVITVQAGTYLFPWRPDVDAAVTVTGSTSDIAVDLVARLGSTTGPIVGLGKAVPGVQTQRVVLQSGPETGESASDSDLYVAAGEAAAIYLMAEKVGGSATYSTTAPRFSMKAVALP